MRMYFNKAAFAFVAAMMAASAISCSSSDDNNVEENCNHPGQVTGTDTNEYGEENGHATANTDFTNKQYGNAAVDGCADIVNEITSANNTILRTNLTEAQERYLQEVVAGVVDNVIIPTYTDLADKTEYLEATLNGLDVNSITQEQVNQACEYFGEARVQWERSEAFLGGAASDFSIDPTIDSWPLSRSKLHTYLTGNMSADELEDESILGFHALEFILFRNGQPRRVAEFRGNDTYSGFSDVSGARELRYAQQVCRLLKERTFQLQVAWQGETTSNAARVEVVKAANLKYKTEKGLTYGEDLKMAGDPKSKYTSLKDAVTHVLSHDEGSACAIANEVGTAKIANPFTHGQISYVESPYSWRSITDFQDNIRSIRNVWYGNTTGSRDVNSKSFYTFFLNTRNSVNQKVINSIINTINAIGGMPGPFVKYCCTVWGKEFSEEEYTEE